VKFLLIMIALVCVLEVAPAPIPSEPAAADSGATAYRAGDYERASVAWETALAAASEAGGRAAAERARLCHNLGNAAWRRDRVAEAAAWYTASLRLRPRDADTWANLELARATAGWDPEDRGDLKDTMKRLLTGLTARESDGAALAALVLLAIALGGEALRGGRTWRRAILGAGVALTLAVACAIGSRLRETPDIWMVTHAGGASLHSEPRDDALSLGRLEPGARARAVDELPDWVRLVTEDAPASWVRREHLFSLER
jgi:tetratricopeptide (TPR) repeat protein